MPTRYYTIYRSVYDNSPGSTSRFLRIIASDEDSGSNEMINYYIGMINICYFTSIKPRKRSFCRARSWVSTVWTSLSSPSPFNSMDKIQAHHLETSDANATVMIYSDNGDTAPSALWLDPIDEELNFPILEKYDERHGNRSIFSGTILYQLTSQTSSLAMCP